MSLLSNIFVGIFYLCSASACLYLRTLSFVNSRPLCNHIPSLMSLTRKLPLEDELTLKEADPELYEIIQLEKERQRDSINLIASENYISRASMDALGSILNNKYTEGYPGRRYYGGCQHYDTLETLCIKRGLEAFGLDPEVWGLNVQPLSGSPANLSVYTALLQPHDKILGLSLASGGHLTHGFYTKQKKVSASSIFFTSLSYGLDPDTGLINYKQVEEYAKVYCPKLIIAGASCYTRQIDYKRFREIADSVDALLMADIAHIAGFVAAGLHPSPFEYCHVVSSTTHKTLKGPRSGIIFFNRKLIPDADEKINNAVFPTLQGGPHNGTIASFAVQLNQIKKPEWKVYMTNMLNNARALSDALIRRGLLVVTGGTDNHTVIVNLRPQGITGSKFELVAERANITISKSTIIGDTSPLNPSGIRLGTPPLSSRGALPEDMEFVADRLYEVIEICIKIQDKYGKKLVDFRKGLDGNEDIASLRERISVWIRQFPYVS